MAGSTPTGDGLLKVGKADDPAAAKWRVSVLEDSRAQLLVEHTLYVFIEHFAPELSILGPEPSQTLECKL